MHRNSPWPKRITVAALLLTLAALALWSARRAPMGVSVERSTLWVGRVQQGDMLREVQARGVLVARDVYWVTATTAGRIERLSAVAGERVAANASLAELSNPDLVLQSLEAERHVAAAQTQGLALEEAALQAQLAERTRLLDLEGTLHAADASYKASEQLVATGAVAAIEHERAAADRQSLDARVQAGQAAAHDLALASKAKLGAARSERSRLAEIAKFRRARLDELKVRSAVGGIIAEVRVELGQWVAPGTALAKVVEPTALKARLLVPESQAKDLKLQQLARVEFAEHALRARVTWVAPAVENGTVAVELSLVDPLPNGARPDLAISGSIELERLPHAVFVERPTGVGAEAEALVFRLDGQGRAVRQAVRFGRVSAQTIEVRAGLRPGDEIILSDISKWDQMEQLQVREQRQ